MTNALYLHWIFFYAGMYGVNPYLAQSVALVESGMHQDLVGEQGEIGMFQLMPEYFPNNVDKPKKNIQEGIKYLSRLQKECPYKDNFTFLVCYNRGITGAKLVKHPERDMYYKRVMKQYRKLKYGNSN